MKLWLSAVVAILLASPVFAESKPSHSSVPVKGQKPQQVATSVQTPSERALEALDACAVQRNSKPESVSRSVGNDVR